MYLYEIADKAGVSTKTLRKWIEPHKEELYKLGYGASSLQPPSVVRFICEKFVIILE